MNLNQIESFLNVVRLGSFSKAANNLFVSQSTISQRIYSIEDDYGLTLLKRDRGVKGISLTNEGQMFYQIALEYESLISKTKNIKSMSGEVTVTIGAVDSVHNYILNEIYSFIIQTIPNIRLAIHSHQSNEIYRLIEEREIDIGFSLQDRVLKNVGVKQLFTEQMVLIRKRNNNAYFNIVKNSDLTPDNQIYINWGSENQIWQEKHWGATTNTLIQIDTVKMLQYLIRNDDLWAIAPVSVANYLMQKEIVDMFTLEDPPPNRICYIVQQEGQNQYAKQIVETIFQSLPKINKIIKRWN